MLKVSDGHGAYWTKGFALADDFEDADGKTVLTFHQAQEQAKKLARGGDGNAGTTPITVDGALNAYKTDLTARSANPYNAEWPRVHLTSALLSKPVALLASIELKTWRNGLLDTMAPSTVNRLCACLSAALEQAAQHDKRIQNRDAWEIGLAALPNAQEARNVILSDAKVREFVAAAYRADDKFGLLTDTLAVTGARPSQAVRLRVEDLHDHPVRPKLMMPKSAKGGDRNCSAEEDRALFGADHRAAGGQAESGGSRACRPRAAAAARRRQPLARQSWRKLSSRGRRRSSPASAPILMRRCTRSGIRRSSGCCCKTFRSGWWHRCTTPSTKMIEKHYSKYITEHSDDVSRHALLQPEPPVADNVVALARYKK